MVLSPTDNTPTCLVSLTDGVDTVEMMLCDQRGKDDPTAIRCGPYPRKATQISQGDGKYSDFELPYKPIAQENWKGGRGMEDYELDVTRFLDNYRSITHADNQIILAGQESYATSHRNLTQVTPGNLTWFAIQSTNANYIAHSFATAATPPAGWTGKRATIWVRRVGTPAGNLHIEVWTNVAGSPGVLAHADLDAIITPSEITDTVSQVREVTFAGATLSASTTYWLVVFDDTPGSAANHWEVGTNAAAGTNTKKSTDGAAWSASSAELYYRVVDDSENQGKFFQYKRALYHVETPDSGNSTIKINGDRGAADDNSGDLYGLIDATKSWTINEWAGCKVVLVRGPGSEEKINWRYIVSNTSTKLVVSPIWKVTHTTETEYVILGSDKWQAWGSDITGKVTDVTVANELVYFARDGAKVLRYAENNIGGVWTISSSAETAAEAERVCAIQTATGWRMWAALGDDARFGSTIWTARIPRRYSGSGHLYNLVEVMDDGKGRWDEFEVPATVTQSRSNDGNLTIAVDAAFSTGNIAVKNLANPIDVTRGGRLGMYIKSSIDTLAGELMIRLDDDRGLYRASVPKALLHYKNRAAPAHLVWYRQAHRPAQVMYYDASAAAGEEYTTANNVRDNLSAYTLKFTLEANDWIYVSGEARWDKMTIALGDLNATVSDMQLQIHDGITWLNVASFTDGTRTGGPGSYVMFGQDGDVTLTIPEEWNPGCPVAQADYLPQDQFHMRIGGSNALDAAEIEEITLYCNDITEWPLEENLIELQNAYDTDNTGYEARFTPGQDDIIFIAHPKRFNHTYWKFDALNNNGSSLTAGYWNGKEWLSQAITDGTVTGGATFAVSGAIYWTLSDPWTKGAPTYFQGVLGDDNYCMYLKVSDDLDEVAFRMWVEDTGLYDVFTTVDMDLARDGDTGTSQPIFWHANDWLVVFGDERFNQVYFDWGTANAIAATMSAQYFTGESWSTLAITDGTTTGGVPFSVAAGYGTISFTIPYDLSRVAIGEREGYAVRFKATPTGADIGLTPTMTFIEVAIRNDNDVSCQVEALTANKWEYIEALVTPSSSPNPDYSKITSFGIYNSAVNAITVTIYGGLELITNEPEFPNLGMADERVVAIVPYGISRSNPWILTEGHVYEIQTEANNAPVAIPLQEIAWLWSEVNGQAHTTSDVYLVFNLGSRIERYYQQNLDDIGPDRDAGLPSNRQGDPCAIVAMPGFLYAAFNAEIKGYNPTLGRNEYRFSSVLARRDGGWCEVYRAPYGAAITDMHPQVVPGAITRMWVAQGGDLVWFPLPTRNQNPYNDPDYRFTHEGVVVSGWISAGMLDVEKLYKALKLFTDNLSGTSQFVIAEYQTEAGELDSGWNSITDTFDTSPFQEIDLTSTYTTKARRLRYRLRLMTNDNTITPVVKATVIEALLRIPTKNQYSFYARLEDHPETMETRDALTRVETKKAKLDTWSDAPTALTFHSVYSIFDNLTVVLEPVSLRPTDLDPGQQYEKHIVEITLLEI